jgi:hypothetical protein
VISWLSLPSSVYFFLIRNILCPRTVYSNSSGFFGSSIGNSLLYNFSSCWVWHCEIEICIWENSYIFNLSFIEFPDIFQGVAEIHDEMGKDENCPHFSIFWAPDHNVGMLLVFGNKIGSLEEEMAEIILYIFCFDGDMF